MDKFKEKIREFFWPSASAFGILLIGVLIYPKIFPDDPVVSPERKSSTIQSQNPSESIGTNKPKNPQTTSKNPKESIDTKDTNKLKSTQTKSKKPNESIDNKKPKSTPTPRKNTNGVSLETVLLGILLILLAVSILTNILFFKWRFKANDKQVSIVPQELIADFEKLEQKFKEMKAQHTANLDQSERASKNTEKSFEELIESLTVLLRTLDSNDKEIQRLKKGYDSEIFSTFLRRFIRVDKALCEEINALNTGNNVDLNDLEGVQDVLRDALEDCKVFPFSPEIRGDFRKEPGIADNPKTRLSKNPEDDFLIAEVIEEGFKLVTAEGSDQYIQKAKVVIFKFEKGV